MEKIRLAFPRRLDPSERVLVEAGLFQAGCGPARSFRRSVEAGCTVYHFRGSVEEAREAFSDGWAGRVLHALHREHGARTGEALDLLMLRLGISEYTMHRIRQTPPCVMRCA